MTFRPRQTHRARTSGFTLIEVLVVLLILVLLAGIVIPAVVFARKRAKASRTEMDMRSLGAALEAYKSAHGGQYPKTGGALNTGFAVLGRELAGLYGDGYVPGNPPTPDTNDPPQFNAANTYNVGDCVQSSGAAYVALETTNVPPMGPASPAAVWAAFNPLDGRDTPGGKTAAGTNVGPYIQEGKFHIRGCAILDPDDHAILYFPATGNPNVKLPVNGGPSFVSDAAGPNKFNANDNLQFFIRKLDAGAPGVNALRRIRVMVGDANFDGIINNGENEEHNGSYILWAPGPDGFYGPKTSDDNAPLTSTVISKCDDIIVP
jgi:prepilin-type N-terminal cleavage/methylation domain-containing protein